MQISDFWRGGIAGLALCIGCSTPPGSSISARDVMNLEAAELALAREQITKAVRSFDRVLKGNPHNSRALLGSARANLIAARGAISVARFDAYRRQIDAWKKIEHWEFCEAIALSAGQALESGKRPARALALSRRLQSENCDHAGTGDLILQSGLALADRTRAQGQQARALEMYLELVSSAHGQDASIARAYLGAAEILVMNERREEALALLSGGLDKFPSNRDLVHQMLTVLADGSSVVFPRAKPPERSQPASPE